MSPGIRSLRKSPLHKKLVYMNSSRDILLIATQCSQVCLASLSISRISNSFSLNEHLFEPSVAATAIIHNFYGRLLYTRGSLVYTEGQKVSKSVTRSKTLRLRTNDTFARGLIVAVISTLSLIFEDTVVNGQKP